MPRINVVQQRISIVVVTSGSWLEFSVQQQCLCYAKQMTQGWPQYNFRMGLVISMTNHLIRRLELVASHLGR